MLEDADAHRGEVSDELVRPHVEGGVFVRHLGHRRQAVGRVVDEVPARREAAAVRQRLRVPDRHALVDVSPTCRSPVEGLQTVATGVRQVAARLADQRARRRQDGQLRTVGHVERLGDQVADAVVYATTLAHDGAVDALVLAHRQSVLEGVRAAAGPWRRVRTVAVRPLDTQHLVRLDADRHRVAGHDVIAVDRRVGLRVGRVHHNPRPPPARQRRVRLLHARHHVHVLTGSVQLAGTSGEEQDGQAVLDALQPRAAGRQHRLRLERVAVEVVRVKELDERRRHVALFAHELAADDEVVQANANVGGETAAEVRRQAVTRVDVIQRRHRLALAVRIPHVALEEVTRVVDEVAVLGLELSPDDLVGGVEAGRVVGRLRHHLLDAVHDDEVDVVAVTDGYCRELDGLLDDLHVHLPPQTPRPLTQRQ